MSAIEKITDSWQSVFRTLVFLSVCLCILFIFIVQLNKHVNPGTVSVSSSDGVSITFNSSETLNDFLVHPRGWQPSGIKVNKGDSLNFDASGSVHIAMERMIGSLTNQYSFKLAYQKEGKIGTINDFTDAELDASIFFYPWNGPE